MHLEPFCQSIACLFNSNSHLMKELQTLKLFGERTSTTFSVTKFKYLPKEFQMIRKHILVLLKLNVVFFE